MGGNLGLTEAQKRNLKLKVEFKCQICDGRYDPEVLDIPPIYPVKYGGSDRPHNLIVLCPTCHRKADRGLIPRERLKRAKKKKRKGIESQISDIVSRKDENKKQEPSQEGRGSQKRT
jgi:5-methylcytosine-specific restriction endonuclease McrA